jgi:hypothetical protein
MLPLLTARFLAQTLSAAFMEEFKRKGPAKLQKPRIPSQKRHEKNSTLMVIYEQR